MSNIAVVAVRTPEAPSDDRWAHWVAKGVLEDRKMKRRATSVAIALACGLAAWLTTALLLR